MKRREFAGAVGACCLVPFPARAQQAGPVLGFLDSGSSTTSAERVAWFHRGLAEAGFIEGKNISIEFRWAEGHYDRLPALAADLVRRQVTILAATGSPNSARAALAATDRIPIVFANGGDPVRDGLVTSLNRPTGNSTGISYFNSALGTKRLGLLREFKSLKSRVGFVVNPANPNAKPDVDDLRAAARAAGLETIVLEATHERDVGEAFVAAAREKVEGLIVNNDTFFTSRAADFAASASRHAVPTIFSSRVFAVAGGLVSYGTSTVDGYRKAGAYVGRILKGAHTTELPVELSSRFELVINLKTAASLGLAVPSTLLAVADEVIE